MSGVNGQPESCVGQSLLLFLMASSLMGHLRKKRRLSAAMLPQLQLIDSGCRRDGRELTWLVSLLDGLILSFICFILQCYLNILITIDCSSHDVPI